MRITSFPMQCDDCQNPINNEGEAMIEWIDDGTVHSVRIVHNPKFSPARNCYIHTSHPQKKENHFSFVMKHQTLRDSLGIA